MENLKKLYVLLAILIVIYVGINFAYNGLDTINSLSHVNLNVGLGMPDENNGENIKIGTSFFSQLKNFKDTKINNETVKLINSNNNISIKVCEIDSSLDLESIIKNLLSTNENITSNQTVSQNGITAYFLYEESADTYNADIYFNKNNKNYLIGGENINYEKSDYFINSCKDIINSMQSDQTLNYSRF